MFAFIVRRLIGMVAVLFGVSVLVYVVFILVPGGDPAQRMAGKNPLPANITNIREKWGFNKPFYVQYVKMMEKAFNGVLPGKHGEYDILTSFQNRQNVIHEIKKGIPATMSLCIGAGIIWLFFGILVGFFSAVTAGRFSDRLITTFALIGVSMPVAWLAIMLRYYLAEKPANPVFPDGEYVPFSVDPVQWAYHLLLPWFCLSVLFIGFYGRVLRSNMLDGMNEEYVRTAKAKGLSGRRVLMRHVLRNSLIPIVTLFGLDFAAVLGGGAILTETVFDLKGVGWYAAQSVGDLDLPPIMGITLYGAFFIVIFSTLVDVIYAYLDPRIRLT
ncbi:MAG TPA: ABC transporter permease [Gaiellaceae bacterium]|jgi:peptide/nickel transport system permease protein|nr:ABC transporter permease [Gaiellaceae bacterium]